MPFMCFKLVLLTEKRIVAFFTYVAYILFFLQGIYIVSHCAVAPFEDEFEVFTGHSLSHQLHWDWVFRLHNEHRLALTRLIYWFFYRTTALHPTMIVAFNYTMFVGLCLLLCRYLMKHVSPLTVIALPLLACSIPSDIHYWAFQSHFYGHILLGFCGFIVMEKWPMFSLLGTALAIFSGFSFASGLFYAGMSALLALLFAFYRKPYRLSYILSAILPGIGILRWFYHHPVMVHQNPVSWPWLPSFWKHLFCMMARGFGYDTIDRFHYFLPLFVLVLGTFIFYIFQSLLKFRHQFSGPQAVVLALLCSLLLTLVSISMGRGSFGRAQGASLRYAGIVLIVVFVFWSLINKYLMSRRLVLTLIVGLWLWVPFFNEFNYSKISREKQINYLDRQYAFWQYYLGEHDGYSVHLNPFNSVASALDNIWNVDIYAIQEFKKLHPQQTYRYEKKKSVADVSIGS